MSDDYKAEQQRRRLTFRALGVRLYLRGKRCPLCGNPSYIRRPATKECLHCVLGERKKARSA